MHLVAGLGNPGPKYEVNRHNIGFLVVDELVDRLGTASPREKFKGEFTKGNLAGDDVGLLKPMVFMNLSGESVQPALHFFKVPATRLIVIHDEVDLDFGDLRIKSGGGTAGHNGLKSIVSHCGGNDFLRLRFGVGRCPHSRPTAAWVLSDFSASDRAELGALIERAADMVEAVIQDGAKAAMNRFHG